MTTTAQRMTVEEYLALPECKPYLEYWGGEVRAKVQGSWEQFILGGRVTGVLVGDERDHGGESGVQGTVEFDDPADHRFLLPDVSYYARDREQRGRRAMTAPTLAIEIRSKGESMASQRDKCHYYVGHGVDVAVLFDPENQAVEVFEGGEHRVFESPAVVALSAMPGLAFDLKDLFAGLD